MPGSANNGGEDSTRGIISSKTGFAHTGAVVNDQGSDFLIHGCKKGEIVNAIVSISLEGGSGWRFWRLASRRRKGAGKKPSGLRQRKWSGSLTIALYGNKLEQLNAADSARGIRPTDHSQFQKAEISASPDDHHYDPDACKISFVKRMTCRHFSTYSCCSPI